ncbi:MAG: phosphoribosylanthranilate isomerase [Actinobacteria bacterium]|nr:phosphoribosylanthranilate isomerase [Actinomycetota bacterium]
MTLVKICGMTNTDDVDQAVAAGADMIGFVLVPWSPRAVDLDAVRKLRRHVPRGIEAVGVLADETAGYAAQVLEMAELDRVQVYGPHAAETREVLGERALVGYRLPADEIGADDPVLLDRAFGDEPTAEELAAHWDVVAELGRAGRRVVLAGALSPDNVAAAVSAAQPWGVDVARGVEREPGIKDHDRVSAFIAAAREGKTA